MVNALLCGTTLPSILGFRLFETRFPILGIPICVFGALGFWAGRTQTSHPPHHLFELERSVLMSKASNSTCVNQHREKYLKEVWPHVTSALKEHGIACVLDLVEGSMSVKTTRKTHDPYIIVKVQDTAL